MRPAQSSCAADVSKVSFSVFFFSCLTLACRLLIFYLGPKALLADSRPGACNMFSLKGLLPGRVCVRLSLVLTAAYMAQASVSAGIVGSVSLDFNVGANPSISVQQYVDNILGPGIVTVSGA